METPILVAVVGLLVAPIAAFVTWALNKRQGLANIYNSLSETQQNAVETINTALQAVRTELDVAHSKIDQLLTENESLRESIRQLLRENDELRKQVVELTKTLQQFVSAPHDVWSNCNASACAA